MKKIQEIQKIQDKDGFFNYITNVQDKISRIKSNVNRMDHKLHWHIWHIENTNKLTFLKSLKEVYKSETHLQIKNVGNRRATTKLNK